MKKVLLGLTVFFVTLSVDYFVAVYRVDHPKRQQIKQTTESGYFSIDGKYNQ